MGQRTWTVQFEDGVHTIELEHGYWSGKRRIMVDGSLVHQGGGWIKVWAVGARDLIRVGSHACMVVVKPNFLTNGYDYELRIDPPAARTQRPASTAEAEPSREVGNEVGTYSDSVASDYQSGLTHARWAAALLGIVIGLYLLELISNLMQAEFLARLADGVQFTQEQVRANDARHGMIVLTRIVAYIGCIVAYCIWFSRAIRNAIALAFPMEYSPARMVWNWFIPFVNLVAPFRAVRDLWESSAIPSGSHEPAGGATVWLRIWWGLWLSTKFVNGVVNSLTRSAKEIADFQWMVRWAMIDEVLIIGAGLLALWTVLGITRRQDELYRHQVLQAR